MDIDIKLFDKAIELCEKNAKGKRGIVGTIKCPKCGGKLNYSVSDYNGHIHGQCETKDCLAWRQ